MAFMRLFILLMSLLPAPAYLASDTYQANPYDPTLQFYMPPDCDSKSNRKVNPNDCIQALKLIKYETDGTLYAWESHFERAFGTCVLVYDSADLYNREGNVPIALTQKQIEGCFTDILKACKVFPGTVPISLFVNMLFRVRPRGNNPLYEDDFPPDTPVCGTPIVQDDCLKAYDGLRVDGLGHFWYDGRKQTNVVKKTHANCLVEIYTSDGTFLEGFKEPYRPQILAMMRACKGKAATMILASGTEGLNGRVFLRYRNIPK